MVWYSDGSIQVAANGVIATGTGTKFLDNVQVGDGLTIAGSASLHEVIAIASDVQLTFQPPYTGEAGSGKAYRTVPIQGHAAEAARRLVSLTKDLGEFAANNNLKALAAAVGAANKGLMFTASGAIGTFDLSAQGRTFLAAATQAAQQSALGLVAASGPTDFTVGRLMTAGYAGLGSLSPAIPANIDDLTNIQFFQGNANNGNPFGSTGSTGIHLQQASSFGWQIVGPNGGNTLSLKWRNRSAASVWGAWRDIWDSTNQLGIGKTPLSARTALEINQGVVIQPAFFDFNAGPYIVTGEYTLPALADTGFSNRPVNASGLSRAYLKVYETGGYVTQTLSLNNNRTFSRSFNGASWTVWSEAWGTSNLQKQASVSDTTADAVLINGAYGLGGSGMFRNSIADTNSDRGCEFFINSQPATSSPFPTGYLAGIHCAYGNSAYAMQFVGGVTANRYFARYKNNGTWQAAVEFWHTANLIPNKLEDRTIATLPAAGPNKGQMFHCTNTARGLRPVISDGVDWRRVEDNALLSAA